MKISFCIASLNRPDYLAETILSICNDKTYSEHFEVIVHNNHSDQAYDKVEMLINELSVQYNIKYILSSSRLDIDKSMFQAIEPAVGEYLFLIGDDDFLAPNGVNDLFDLLKKNTFDMAVFNATIINDWQGTKTELIRYSDRAYHNLEDALLNLKIYCTYGIILLKRKFFDAKDFEHLIGTSHAYGCFWLSFFRDFEEDLNPVVIVPEKSVVNLRVAKKNYNLLEVMFKHADLEYSLYLDIIGEKSKMIFQKYVKRYWNSQSSIIHLAKLGTIKDLALIKEYNRRFYKDNWIKIQIARFGVFILNPFRKPLRHLIKKIISN